MTAEPRCWGGVSHPLQLTTGLVIKIYNNQSPPLAGEHMLFILQVSILSEQTGSLSSSEANVTNGIATQGKTFVPLER